MSDRAVPSGEEEGHWEVVEGEARERRGGRIYDDRGVERLTYNNPYNLDLERVWFDGRTVYASEQGELEIDLAKNKVAQEYQIVYSVELDEKGKLKGEPERVDGQYNIYDSVPGMEKYSPLWRFNYVIVPRDYAPNTLRSEQDCLASGYEIRQSTVVEN
ncbi:MAG: hypothetical protein WEB00_12085 [Dehalococcoidia bacterium]